MTDNTMLLSREPREQIFDHFLEEEFLIDQLESLGVCGGCSTLYWLSMARIMELALLCAGNYADFGRIREAADLIVNPRHTELHINGIWEPVRVKRYESMTEQFAEYAPAGSNVGAWLRDNTHLVRVQGPLIPDLYDMLLQSDMFSASYLASLMERIEKVSETMTFVMQGQVVNPDYPLSGVHPEEIDFVELHLCRYNRDMLKLIDEDVRQMHHDKTYRSRVLKDEVVPGQPVSERGWSLAGPACPC